MLPMSRIFRCSHALGSAIPRDAMCSSVMSFDCSSVKYADFRPSWSAFWYRIENASEDFIVPGAPLTRTIYPSGMPLARMSSKPRTYVLTRFRSIRSLRGRTNARTDLSLSPRKSGAIMRRFRNVRVGTLTSLHSARLFPCARPSSGRVVEGTHDVMAEGTGLEPYSPCQGLVRGQGGLQDVH